MKMNKKGQLNLNLAKSVFIIFLVLAVLAIAVLLAMDSLRTSNIFTDQSQAANDTENIANNISGGIEEFFGNATTVFSILIVVVIITAIGIVIYVVSRFGGGSGGGL